ncbi:2Fe-2S iron-sulfur cluster-binding protein [Variovorax sp. Varisp62]|uniref:2Fe-2S iron-sulfur cluster-binding protein n=1 Tax=Variovorax sp. Varisp62 TaxID=3243049 RepID=UPI0039B4AD01
MTMTAHALLHRVAEKSGREAVPFTLDGAPAPARARAPLLTALRPPSAPQPRHPVRGLPRAGFCMMGACQDCWIATDEGERLRACSTFIAPGMALVTGKNGA